MTGLEELESVDELFEEVVEGCNTALDMFGVGKEDTELYMKGENPECYEDAKNSTCIMLSQSGVSDELCDNIYNETLFIDMNTNGELLDEQRSYHGYLSAFNSLLSLETLDYTVNYLPVSEEDILAVNNIAGYYFESLEDLKYNVVTCIPHITYRVKMQENVFYVVAISYMRDPLRTLALSHILGSLNLDVLLISEDFKECYKSIAQFRVENGVPLIERINNPCYFEETNNKADSLKFKGFKN